MKGSDLKVGRVSCRGGGEEQESASRELCFDQIGVRSYPSVAVFRDGHWYSGDGSRNAKDVLEWYKNEEYLKTEKAHRGEIPRRYTEWEKKVEDWKHWLLIKKNVLHVHYAAGIKQIHRDFERYGLGAVPEKCRVYTVVTVAVILLYFILSLCCGGGSSKKVK